MCRQPGTGKCRGLLGVAAGYHSRPMPARRALSFVRALGGEAPADDGVVVALTPVAFEALRRSGIVPSVVDDHVARPELCLRPEAYERWQLDWLRRLDREVGADGVVRSCAQLLTVPMDSVVVWSRMLVGVVEAVRPDAIRYWGRTSPEEDDPYHNGHLQFWPRLGDLPLAVRLLPLIASVRSIRYELHDAIDESPAPTSPVGRTDGARRRAVQFVGAYRRLRPGAFLPAAAGTTLMLWHAWYGAERIVADERRRGRRTVFLERRGDMVRIVDPRLPSLPGTRLRVEFETLRERALAAGVQALLGEVDEWAGAEGAGRLLTSRLATFLGSFAPAVRRLAEDLEPELSRRRVDRVLAANPSSVEEFACLLAAGRRGIPRTLVQHGDHVFSYGPWLINETQNFEELAASDPTVPPDLVAAADEIGTSAPRTTAYAPRIDALVARAARSRAARRQPGRTVAYVPLMLTGDTYVAGGSYLDDTWYHRWHRRLLDAMATWPDVNFVWKALPAADQATDPIAGIIAQRRLANVCYETRPFLKVAGDIDAVFTDYPSTAFYEAVALHKPVLGIVFSRFAAVRDSAVRHFANVLPLCETEDDALDRVGSFLAGSGLTAVAGQAGGAAGLRKTP